MYDKNLSKQSLKFYYLRHMLLVLCRRAEGTGQTGPALIIALAGCKTS
jgi:hypothetical protein